MAKDAKGHGSEKRAAAQGRVNEYAARSAARQSALVAGGMSPLDAYHQTGDEFKNGPPGGYESDKQVADTLAQGHLKSGAVPVHGGASGRNDAGAVAAESIKAFTDKYGGPRDHAAEQRGFNRGKREINRLKRQGK